MVSRTPKKTPSKESVQLPRSHSKVLKLDSSPISPNKAKRTLLEQSFTHHLPTEEQRKGNGRVSGRNLIQWKRPRMADKLLLHIQFECSRHKIKLPWDAIAHRLHPGSSGAAIIQHFGRLRRDILAEGHLVPPPVRDRSSTALNAPEVRGFILQDVTGDDKETTRPVTFDEKVDDLAFSLPSSLESEFHGLEGFEEMADAEAMDFLDMSESPYASQDRLQEQNEWGPYITPMSIHGTDGEDLSFAASVAEGTRATTNLGGLENHVPESQTQFHTSPKRRRCETPEEVWPQQPQTSPGGIYCDTPQQLAGMVQIMSTPDGKPYISLPPNVCGFIPVLSPQMGHASLESANFVAPSAAYQHTTFPTLEHSQHLYDDTAGYHPVQPLEPCELPVKDLIVATPSSAPEEEVIGFEDLAAQFLV